MNPGDRKLLKRLGYGSPPDLPPPAGDPRPAAEVLDRLLALQVVVGVANGTVDAAAAGRLLDGYDVRGALTADEVEYLDDAGDGVRVEDAARSLAVEAVAVLAWALDLADEPPLDAPADAPEVAVPDAPVLRSTEELARLLVLHDAMAVALAADPDLAVGAAPGAVDPYVVHERRAALAWLFAATA